MSETNPPTIIKYKKLLKVITVTHNQTKNDKSYANPARRINIPNKIFDLLPAEDREKDIFFELEFDAGKKQLIFTYKSPPLDAEKIDSNE